MSSQNSSCKMLGLFCKQKDDIINVNFFSSSDLKKPTNRALCLSGGGSRAFVLSIVIMRELEYANKINNFDIIGSVSGGSWANCMYQYGQYDSRKIYLGTGLKPENITLKNISHVPSECVLSCVINKVEDDIDLIIKTTIGIFENDGNIGAIWKNIINNFYLQPFNISSTSFFAESEHQVKNILDNQASLNRSDFIIPTTQLPMPLFLSTILGPYALEPYLVGKNANFTIFEMSSYYTGIYFCPNNGNITYTNEDKSNKETIAMDGYINSQAFTGILQDDKTSVKIDSKFSLLDAISLSSWSVGAFIDTIGYLPEEAYYKETFTNKNSNHEFLYADGATTNNDGVIPMVQREIKDIFVCVNTNTQFKYYINVDYNYNIDNVPIEFHFAALFGIISNKDLSSFQTKSYDLENMHIFKQTDFNSLILEMKKIEDEGDGILCSIEVETIENKWYNITAGQKINLTIFYPSVPKKWYDRLDDHIKTIVDTNNLPYIPTKVVGITSQDTILIDSMTTWTVNKYMDIIMN